jgi:hypothetical protein
MLGPKNTTKEHTLRSERRSARKKRLTGSALLEMYGSVYQDLARIICFLFRTNDIHKAGLACPHYLKFAPNLLRQWAEELYIRLVATGSMRSEVLQGFKEAKSNKVCGVLVRISEKLFEKLEDSARLVEISLFVYVLNDEVNKFSHIVVGASGISAPPRDVHLPTVGEVREGFSKRGNHATCWRFPASEQKSNGSITVDGFEAHIGENSCGKNP